MLQRGWGSRGKECGRTTLTCPQNSQRGLLSALHPHPQALSSWFQGSLALAAWKGTEPTLEASADPFQRCGRSSLWSGRASLQEGGQGSCQGMGRAPSKGGGGSREQMELAKQSGMAAVGAVGTPQTRARGGATGTWRRTEGLTRGRSAGAAAHWPEVHPQAGSGGEERPQPPPRSSLDRPPLANQETGAPRRRGRRRQRLGARVGGRGGRGLHHSPFPALAP